MLIIERWKNNMTGMEKGKIAKEILDERKSFDTVLLDVAGQTVMTEAILIGTGQNKKQVQALADYCEEHLEEQGVFKIRREIGDDWILLDYGDLMIHIFLPETRERYNLEKLWQ